MASGGSALPVYKVRLLRGVAETARWLCPTMRAVHEKM
eukprot:COSAG05_NODE_6840_length_893_cov_2.011335_2_plen_37_part_01